MQRVLKAVTLANRIYETEAVFRESCERHQCALVQWLDVQGTQAAVVADAEERWIVFRGTEPEAIGDWRVVFDARLVQTIVGSVHHGFWEAVDGVDEALLDAAGAWRTDPRPLMLCGHSMGGALAMVLGALARHWEVPVATIYTFGSPRAGDAAFAARVNDLVWRFVNNNDVVPRLPARWFNLRRSDPGRLFYFDCCGDLVINPSRFARLIDRVAGRIRACGSTPLDGIRDHDRQEYERLVQRNVLHLTLAET